MSLYCRLLSRLVSVLFFLWSAVAWADARLMILDNPIRLPFSGFASALTVVGDVDGDEIADYLVGAYDQRWKKNERQGRAFVFSGRSGKLLYTVDHPVPQAYAAFGFAVAAPGDVNADEVPDFVIGAFGQGGDSHGRAFTLSSKGGPVEKDVLAESSGHGQAFVFSGKDGQFLHSLQASPQQAGGGFGWAIAPLGDLTADGIAELVVGAFGQEGQGRAFVFNGQDGSLLLTLAPPQSGLTFGWSVAGAGDLNKDGTPDILVGAPYTSVGEVSVQGRAYAFSGQDGSLLLTFENPEPQPGAAFGWRVASSGDVNKDDTPDVMVGSPYQDSGANTDQGAVFVFSGEDGALLFPLTNPAPTKRYASFGWVVEKSADVNQDEVPELLVGAPYQTVDEYHVQGEVFLFNGQDGRHLTTFDNPYPHQGSMFGYSIASPGDLNNDGIPEFAFGALGQSILDKAAVGRVFVFLSQR